MSTSSQNTAPDFGEPWKCETGDFEIYSKSEHNATAYAESARIRDRIIKCVNACQGMADPAAEIEAMRAAISEAHEAFKVSLIRAYTAGYQHGHEATVEGGFIPVHHSDETEFHAENIHQMLCDGSLPESSALSKLQPFLP